MSGLDMGDRHDYVALEWVKGEIAETLKQARQALEDYVEQPRDNAGLGFCLTYIHQVHSILQMVEFFGAALLSEEMELLAQALLDEQVTNVNEALEVLMQSILQLPRYLERIQSARRDLPMAVLPLLNDLRAARGEKFLSQSSLFNPHLPEALPALQPARLQRLAGPQLDGLLRKMRQAMQMAMIGLLRDQQSAQGLTQLARVFAGLEKLCQGAPLLPLWQVASGLIDGLANRSLELSTSVRSLLRQLDGQLRELVRLGAPGLNQPVPEELLKNILFYVAKAQPNSARLQQLHQTYGLAEALPVDALEDTTADRDAIRSVVSALCEELVRIKDSLDLFVRSDRSALSELDNLQQPLKQIADTLAVLGFSQQRKVVLEQADTLRAIAASNTPVSDASLMDVAGALLYLEATLIGMVGSAGQAGDVPPGLTAATDMAQVQRLVIREARTGLEEAKDGIIEFIASQWQHQHLEPVSTLLNQVRGGLAMISLSRASGLVDSARRYIDEKLLAPQAVPGWQELDTLADAITSVDYYLERLHEDQTGDNELVLDTAALSMAALGYPLPEPALQEKTVEQTSGLDWVIDQSAAIDADEGDDTGISQEAATGDDQDEESLQDALDAAVAPLLFDSLTGPETGQEPEAEEESRGGAATVMFVPADEEVIEHVLLDSFELPDVELPQQSVMPAGNEDAPSGVQDILATPINQLNPPATEMLEHLLPPPADEEPVDEELQEVFVEEAGEVLDTLNEFFPLWQQDPDNSKALTEVRRAFHTLKGSGRMVRALVAGELAWSIENMLNRVIEGSVEPSAELLQVIADVIALLPALIEEYAGRSQRQRDDVDRLAAIAHALARKEPVPVFTVTGQQPLAVVEVTAEGDDIVEPEEPLDPVLVDIFHSEAVGHLQILQDFVAGCEQFLPRSVSEDLQRAMHTLKGSAHMAGITPVAELATASERLVKEYRAHLFSIDTAEAALLSRSAQLLGQGLEQLTSTPLQTLPGGSELAQELNELLEQRLACEQRQPASAPDPLLISRFLAEGMNLLLDMDEHLQRWRTHPAEHDQLLELIDELSALQSGAHMAELEPIEALAGALSEFYQHVHAGRQQLGDQQFAQVASGHDALINMMDEVAAGLDVTPQPELVDSLRQLLAQTGTDAAVPVADELAPVVLPAELPAATAPEAGRVYAVFDPDMVEIFLDEALDLMDSAGENLEQWLAAPDNTTCLTALMRDLHTLKGGARMAGIVPVGDLAHELESVYEGLLDGRYTGNSGLAPVLHAAHDRLSVLLEQLQGGQELRVPLADIEGLQAFRTADAVSLSRPVADDRVLDMVMPQDAEIDRTASDSAAPAEHAIRPQTAPEPSDSTAVTEQDSELVEIFLEEAFEVLEHAAGCLQAWLAEQDNFMHVEAMQRDLHTLKGGARMAEISAVADLAHELEFLYEDLTSGRMQTAAGLDAFLYQAHDQLNDMLEAVRDGQPLIAAGPMVQQARGWRRGEQAALPIAELEQEANMPLPPREPAEVPAGESEADAQPEADQSGPTDLVVKQVAAAGAPSGLVRQALPFMRSVERSARSQQQGPQEQVRIPAELLEGLVNLAGETSIFRGRIEQQVSDFGFTLNEMETTLDRIRDQLRRLDTETQAQILSRLQTEGEGADYAEFDPLEMDRHSQLQQLSRSLFESASDLLDLKETLSAKSRDAETLLLQQSRVNTELQEGLMRTRMVPFERLVPRLRRIVRQVSAELGKAAELQVTNAEGEMDRSVMERMMAPLEHMLRNAIAHGLELPEVRQHAGKPATGRIQLELGREGADILLTLSDDGAGINVAAVRDKAIERGLMVEGSELSDQEIMQFILHAGFSTASEVTQVSGRGVGMDVVSSEIKQLGGAIGIESRPGQGTRFVIRLPFTVSVNRALMVMTGEDLYAIPLNTIEGIVRVSPYELEALYGQAQQGEPARYDYAGQSYDLKYLGDLLVNGQQPKLVGQNLPLPVLLVRSSEHAMAIQVDSLAGSREIVVKSLGPQFAGVPSLSGATILGDGRVVVILDLLAAIRSRYALAGLPGSTQSRQPRALASGNRRALHVMVVDDSVTVRKVTSRLLERYGMHVTTAKDGVDAINQLQEHRPDIMLLDIEMPRMDGFEVATLVRHDEQLRDLPIIMITSRTGDKHRERALEIGVNEYAGKPYQEAWLLDRIRQLTGQESG
ncbi:Hpt domain-containing protein [Thiopseudomonas denitrificans]|uniref:Chemotaxis protein CheA n=1 Tax=Thiopseudomonas denitrificans TaxID=1501432 RepID=A0A4R6U522_9GAMM|nr:Hpt domain-containing protein [Thiopseudomonas denitrificans]TDQ38124.1 chemosensory pili system protein ChpA (sensor histidine kinase/response regulator) [Thiopseudomonas denitrificans]